MAAIKTMGGPTIPWSSGRVDEMDPSTVTPDGRLPNADSGPPGADSSDAAHLRTIFNRMGFDDQEIVCLSGAHALGRCHAEASGYVGPWTPTPTTFVSLVNDCYRSASAKASVDNRSSFSLSEQCLLHPLVESRLGTQGMDRSVNFSFYLTLLPQF